MPNMELMTVTLGTGDQVADIRTTWGMDFPPERRWTDGWGVSVELPAVLELIDLARDGVVSLDDVREQLAARAHEIAVENDPGEADPERRARRRCFGDCDTCQAKKPEFEAHHAHAVEQKARHAQPDLYPVSVGGSSLHRVTCWYVQDQVRSVNAGDDPRWPVWRDLRDYAHDGSLTTAFWTQYTALPRHEAASWIGEHTGTRGGKRYRTCKLCDPDLTGLTERT
ncbi:hypothetical protein OTB19_39405 [Streptomyces sp. H27-H5]|uniref:hypothetical protein n=2 Tax=unclassified Streptomyces TaxID=2593676 RepID=UPI0022702144|nr:hypothetical protein [Streptomyces sp. H27-G5]MCY0924250.1 hypothetical protein [Streptomyces sp. H27-G5]MCY0962886.1 hypothetical protein [Streptomyces sp. H27-H5]